MYDVRGDLEPLMQAAIRLSGQDVEPNGRLYGSYHLPGFTNEDAFRNTLERFHAFAVPERLDGLDVLDLGSNTGALSFEAARRGARRVHGVEFSHDRAQLCRQIAEKLDLPCAFLDADLDVWHPERKYDVAFCCSVDAYLALPARLYELLPNCCRVCYFESNLPTSYPQLPELLAKLWPHCQCVAATRTERQAYVLWHDDPPYSLPDFAENRLWDEPPPAPESAGIGYCFDFQGTLVSADRTRPRPELIELARSLVASGQRVYLVSSCSETHRGQLQDLEFIRDLAAKWQIPSHGIYLAYFQATPTEGHVYRAGQSKAALMKELQARVLFDDLPEICQAVRDAGLTAIHV